MVNYKDLGLVNTREMFKKAIAGQYAIAAFNFNNMEQMQAIIQAAVETKSPVILQVSSGARKYANQTLLRYMAQGAVEYAKELGCAHPQIVLHLDHGDSVTQVENALKWGYTSVMFDGSRLPYDENVRLTRHCAELAKAAGASIEGEIGHVAMGDDTALTEPEEAEAFASAAGVDALAVSIGTAHGYYRSEPKLDIARCRAIAERLPDVPLVLHGGSGTPLSEIRKAIGNGIAKINVATEFQHTFLKSAGTSLAALDGKFVPVDKFMEPVIDDCAAYIARLIRFFAGR